MSASVRTSVWTRLVRRYGWRAYAVPVLALLTIVVLLRPGGSSAGEPQKAATKPVTQQQPQSAPASSELLSAPQDLPKQTDPHDATACATNTSPQHIMVSISQQHAWACQGTKLMLSVPVTTGVPIPSRETLVGTWNIQDKQTNRYLTGPGYSEHVDYWIPYDGDFGIHDAIWQTFAFGTDGWKTDGSHGCVHMPLDAMAWVFNWAQVGTPVTINA